MMVVMSCFGSKMPTRKISYDELHDKIAGAWIGQIVGNIYGLAYENKFVDNPGPETWPYDYTKSINKMKAVDGAFSDDDTDVEYLYLLMMEKYGTCPTYEQIREGWMYHIRDRVWLANRASLGLMHHGFTPPFTGDKDINPHWFQIDPQLINEIWSYTAPGMLKYAAVKSDWAARITSDLWAVSPTIHYGVMYANAFFESDIRKLIEEGLKYLPEKDRYSKTVHEMLALYDKYPKDWKSARKAMAEKYYVKEPEMTKTIWNANLNGACGILALLYGNGDVQRTLEIGCAIGFDCDNQTATINGILGVINGAKVIPASLSMPFKNWEKPFNNRYINVTRYDMPDVSIEDMIDRTVKQAVNVVCENGGKMIVENGIKYLIINTEAEYNTPMEFCVGPLPRMEVGKPVDYAFSCAANKKYRWTLKKGTLPAGMKFNNGRLVGKPVESGKFDIVLELDNGKRRLEKSFELLVRTKNIAPQADTIYANVRQVNMDVLDSCWITFGKPVYASNVNVINDGVLKGDGSVFYSLAAKSNASKTDYFGYGWNEKKTINMVAFHYGCMEEFGGWLSSIDIEYLDENGRWTSVGGFKSTPAFPESDTVFYQPHFVEFVFEFKPVNTNGIRVIGKPKVQDHWNNYTRFVSAFTSVTEISVYEDLTITVPKDTIKLTKTELLDKIRGGWAGQTIGVVYGAPTEFKFTGTTIQAYQPIAWSDNYVKYWWDKKPGLFDDIYNDLTFVETFEKNGLDCSVDTLAKKFAFADYHLAHANQVSRYNIRNGIMPPASGNWKNNPHADDLDFQIEADFIGLMAPAMLPEAIEIADNVGHIMNSGDGFFGGAFVAGLYSAAFASKDPAWIIDRALDAIPVESQFYQCIDDVRKLHRQYPEDWEKCWFEMHKKWNKDVGCPKGVFLSFNIDAKINSAYVAIGLLYGNGDFAKSIEIATRCGQDSDCNPATVGGVLGVMNGFGNIPPKWSEPLKPIEALNFQGTDISLEKGTQYSFKHALEIIKKTGGKVTGEYVEIPQQPVRVLPLEQNFINTYPIFRERKDAWMTDSYSFDFDGNGFIIWGNLVCTRNVTADYAARVSSRHIGSEVFGLAEPDDSYVARIEIWIDGQLDQISMMPMKNTERKLEPAWKYQLPEGGHKVELRWLNPEKDYLIRINDIVYYSENEPKY